MMITDPERPLFSIITVTKANQAGLLATERSLAGQNPHLYEWLVADGGQVPETADYLRARPGSANPAVAWWDTRLDAGPYDAMNRALEHAKGEYVLFLNAGDCLAFPDLLAKLADVMAISGPDRPEFLYGDAIERLDNDRVMLKKSRKASCFVFGMFTHHQAMVYRRDRIGVLRFPRAYRIGADYAFTALYLQKVQRIMRVDFPICIFSSGGMAQSHPDEGRRDQHCIRKSFLGISPILSLLILWLQIIAFFLRKHCSPLYVCLRFRGI